ncbi:MAG: hypothetical protein HYT80_08850 [Euryarchaeota archaeon]|nr:hypothetical protein [Euryarchaeota archaeon]
MYYTFTRAPAPGGASPGAWGAGRDPSPHISLFLHGFGTSGFSVELNVKSIQDSSKLLVDLVSPRQAPFDEQVVIVVEPDRPPNEVLQSALGGARSLLGDSLHLTPFTERLREGMRESGPARARSIPSQEN